MAAQTGLSLADAIRESRRNHPQLLASEQQVRAAEALRVQAGLRPNPTITLQSENARFAGRPGFSFSNDTDDFAYITQVFETGGKRARRIEYADAAAGSAELERVVLERQIASRVSLAYWNAAAAAGIGNLLRENLSNFEQIVEYHRNRVKEGAVAEIDLMRVLLERDRLAVTVRTSEQQAREALIALQREMGVRDFRSIRLTDSLTGVRDMQAPDLQAVLAARPELDLARRAIAQSQANVRLQRADWKPNAETFLGYKRATGFNTLIGGVTFALPFFNRHQGLIASAEASVRSAEFRRQAIEVQVRAEVEAAWSAYLSRRELLTGTLQPMRDRADEIARIALAAYREGGIDLLRLLDAQRARLEAMTSFYQALADVQQSVTTLQIATGAPL